MKVEITRSYYDTTKNKELIKAGTQLDVSAERGKVLIDAGVAKEVKEKVVAETKSKKKK